MLNTLRGSCCRPLSRSQADRLPDTPAWTLEDLEKYSSAVSLSDMEVFIFPELIIALALANIMSPLLWAWKDDPWFEGLEKLSPYRKALRVKQFIIDRFSFNLDLDTWGLTTKDRELARFHPFVDENALARSNALFGYEGDKYYFDIDIRRHFGLDKYTSDVIPYWKTETVEAMSAFQRKEGHSRGAGECVSFSVLYYAALFVLGGIPLEDMYMMATPLHSQNFIDMKDGVLTNNRRLVTKAMWCNGTDLSAKARRALENEQVTVVCTNEGYVHTLYPEATMPRDSYEHFCRQISAFLDSPPSLDLLVNFLRQAPGEQARFQFTFELEKKRYYTAAETLFAQEAGSKLTAAEATLPKLAAFLPQEALAAEPLAGRILLRKDLAALAQEIPPELYQAFQAFCRIEPRLPGQDKIWRQQQPLDLRGLESRQQIINYLSSMRGISKVADLAFMAYRDMERAPWEPFLKAALERNPVCLEAGRGRSVEELYEILRGFDCDSIYDGSRLAQPDEVWNFRTGDGLEKALCLWALLRERQPQTAWILEVHEQSVCLSGGGSDYRFPTAKGYEGLRLT